jgi:AbrB family looped-hinge helix DNA binding protein
MRVKITKAGQMSVPAKVRRRWGTSTVIAEDHGDHLVVRPAPDDPIAAARGIFAERVQAGPPLEDARRRYRREEATIEERKQAARRERG